MQLFCPQSVFLFNRQNQKTMSYLEADLEHISRMGRAKEAENMRFRSFLKFQDDGVVDRIVGKINAEVVAVIDCTLCGNCCKDLRPCLEAEEITRLSSLENLPEKEFSEKYTERDEDENCFCLKDAPCRYLEDKKCRIYEDRPGNCRSYPYTHLPGFSTRGFFMVYNYGECPIVYNVMERLKQAMRFR